MRTLTISLALGTIILITVQAAPCQLSCDGAVLLVMSERNSTSPWWRSPWTGRQIDSAVAIVLHQPLIERTSGCNAYRSQFFGWQIDSAYCVLAHENFTRSTQESPLWYSLRCTGHEFEVAFKRILR